MSECKRNHSYTIVSAQIKISSKRSFRKIDTRSAILLHLELPFTVISLQPTLVIVLDLRLNIVVKQQNQIELRVALK